MKWIKPSEIDGEIQAPPSKSMMVRASAAGLLSEGETRIINPSYCDDAQASLHIIELLGADTKRSNQNIFIKGSNRHIRSSYLDCQESGLCVRMFTPIAALFAEIITLNGTGSLLKRPMGMMEGPLKQLGCFFQTNSQRIPVKVKGPLKGGKVRIDGAQSSQFLTGLLMALPLAERDSDVTVTNLKSKPYIAMTLSLLSDFGISIDYEEDFSRFCIKGIQHYKNRTYHVEGDWSGASFFLVAGAICGKIRVHNLSQHSFQADKRILDVLKQVGAKIIIKDGIMAVEQHNLNGFKIDATHCPDLFPPLIPLACCCNGRTVINGVERLAIKESDRAEALVSEFRKIGAKIKIEGNKMIIDGRPLKGGFIHSHGDHRIAMAAAVAGLCTQDGVEIFGWNCVSKSYPDFFKDLEYISRRVK
jgi:3-phosphoshikimate 1-carboxyvinyltransferase